MRDYAVSVQEFGISYNAFRELDYFCRQYGEKRARANQLKLHPGRALCIPPGHAGQKDPAARAEAMRRRLLRDCEMIEQAAISAAPEFYRELIQNVTEKTPVEAIGTPMGREQFFKARRLFYCRLWEMRMEGDDSPAPKKGTCD